MKLMELLPDYYMASPETADLQNTMELEIQALERARDEMLVQLDLQTATWSLKLWELAYGVATDTTQPLEQRRSKVMSRMRGQGTATIKMVKNVAESFVNGSVDVMEYPSKYKFELKFVSTLGRPPNLDDVSAAIAEIKPAHLECAFVFLYRTYGVVGGYTHRQLHSYTHLSIREKALDHRTYGVVGDHTHQQLHPYTHLQISEEALEQWQRQP